MMLIAAIDLGSSLTKSFYLNQGAPHPLLMAPEVAWVQPELLAKMHNFNRDAEPNQVAWVQIGEETTAVGQFAQNFSGDAGLMERKERRAIHKILAMLGAMQFKLEFPSSITANLAVTLPITEFNDRRLLQQALYEAAQTFVFRGEKLSIAFEKLQIFPEGFGLFLTRRGELAAQKIDPRTRTIAVVMFGHRNLSILVFKNGVLQNQSRSDGPGFLNAVEVAASLKGLSASTPYLMETIAQNLSQLRVAGQLTPLDMESINATARESYWKQVKSYLENHLPGGDYEIIVAGGAIAPIRTELVELLQQMGLSERVSFADSIQQQISTVLEKSSGFPDQNRLPLRLADVYAVFAATWAMSRQVNA